MHIELMYSIHVQVIMSVPYQFSIRDASLAEGDDVFITSVFDASLPYLESIGSQAQWGSIPFSQRADWIEETKQQIQESQRNRISDVTDALHVLILEAEFVEQETVARDLKDMHSRVSKDGRCYVSVGFAFARGSWFPTYLPAAIISQLEQTREESLYVEVMVSDSRTKDTFRGAGAALLQELQKYAHSCGKKALYLDGWAGNDRKLIRYYEQQGFQKVEDFSLPRKNKDPWLGSLMQLTI
ncbi:hypothetical protein FB567DRAFT_191426 [Paraphoma chrysanthemicola]|uniref:N-acetyltransferase domain-containing protein n=1 Tax=Paraphoma chrysanthemicola TaxID=798071 RepID=A0A8K0QXR2_9PLEO|nr:hypothetical protein FB567DRAFT_191426 [Paraphoma chrysanthemicola]